MLLSQMKECLNSCLPGTMPDDAIEVLTPGHFIIGCPMQAFLDPCLYYTDDVFVVL